MNFLWKIYLWIFLKIVIFLKNGVIFFLFFSKNVCLLEHPHNCVFQRGNGHTLSKLLTDLKKNHYRKRTIASKNICDQKKLTEKNPKIEKFEILKSDGRKKLKIEKIDFFDFSTFSTSHMIFQWFFEENFSTFSTFFWKTFLELKWPNSKTTGPISKILIR